MPTMRSQRGEIVTILLLAIVVLGGGILATKTLPAFNGDSRRAKEGQQTSAALAVATNAPAAANTASAQVIGQAAARLPDSPAASFIRNEVPIMLARGPVPEAAELLAAEKRLNAYLSGQLDEARKLHSKALTQAGDLRAALTEAQAAKRNADDAISTAAAEKLAANRTAIGFGIIAVLAVVGYLWARSYVTTLGRLVPALDLAYNSADKKAKDILDRTVFATIGDKLDLAQKKIIRKIKDRA